MMKNNLKNKKTVKKGTRGITLIALVVTIIVLLILAGISIQMLTGDNGILQRAGEAKTNTEKANEKEQIQIEVIGSYENNGTLKVETVKNNINNHISNATATSTTTDSGESFPITVEFITTGNKYTIENDGNVDLFVLKNTTWQDNVDYILDEDNKTITLSRATSWENRYIGEVKIEKTAVINQVEYTTKFPNDCSNLFNGATRMTSFSMEDIDTSNVTNMSYMFCGCTSLENIYLSYLDTDDVMIMNEMFADCSSLNELDLSSFKVNNVSSMTAMFYNVSAKLDLSGWKIKGLNIINNANNGYTYLFGANKSEIIIAKNWNVSNAGMLDGTFRGLTFLKSLDVSGWTFGTNQTARGLFAGDTSLKNITGIDEWQLSSFDLNAMPFVSMCQNCTALNNKLTGGIWDNGTWSNGTFTPST